MQSRPAAKRFTAKQGASVVGITRPVRFATSGLLVSALALGAADVFTLDVCKPTPAHPRNDHQLIFPLKDGRLLLLWSEYYVTAKPGAKTGGLRDDMPCRISAKTSADHGRSWGEPFIFQENTGKLNVKNPNLLRLPSGDVLFVYTEWNSWSNRAVFLRRSTDDCKSWGTPRSLSPRKGITNINNDRIFPLGSGRIVLPAFYSLSVWDRNDHWQAFCYYSDDEGHTWHSSELRMDLPKRGAEEPSMVELKDGSLLAVLRTSFGSIYAARSGDDGRTWSGPTTIGLPSSAAPALLKRIPTTGDLLLIWNRNYQPDHHHQGVRTPLSAAISRDDGITWANPKDIERVSEGSAAYPAVTFVGEEALVTYYYQTKRSGGDTGVRLKVMPVGWFYD